MTQDVVASHTIPDTSLPISSLALNDGWLYVALGSNYGSGGALLRINIDSGPDFLKVRQSLVLPAGVDAPFGFRDMAINKGRYLAFTAPVGRIPTVGAANMPSGNIYVIDLAGVGAKGPIGDKFVTVLDLSAYPSSNLGKGPLYITAGDKRGEFLVAQWARCTLGYVCF